MESRDVLKIHGALRRYCTSRVSLRSTLEVQYLLNLPCIFNTSLDSMLYLLTTVKYVYVPSDDTGERGTGFVLIKSF